MHLHVHVMLMRCSKWHKLYMYIAHSIDMGVCEYYV